MNGTITTTISFSTQRPPLWRVLHDLELGDPWRPNLPEVVSFFPNHFVAFGAPWQRLSRRMNPLLTDGKWTAVYGDKLWIANLQGFGNAEDPRANFISGKDLQYSLPRVEALTCGGNVLTGHTGYNLRMALAETLATVKGAIAGSTGFTKVRKSFMALASTNVLFVEMLNGRADPPTADWLREHREFCTYAVTVDGRGTPRRFPQGEQPNGYMADIIHPLMGDPVRYPSIYIPLSRVVRWTASEWPDPYRVYLPK